MKPEEFTSFEDDQPEKGKWVIVTNNIEAKQRDGEMSHVWLSDLIHENNGLYSTFISNSYSQAEHLTHWKYA